MTQQDTQKKPWSPPRLERVRLSETQAGKPNFGPENETGTQGFFAS